MGKDNQPSGCIKHGEFFFFDYVSDGCLLKKVSTAWSLFGFVICLFVCQQERTRLQQSTLCWAPRLFEGVVGDGQ